MDQGQLDAMRRVNFATSSDMVSSNFNVHQYGRGVRFRPFEQNLIEWATELLIPGKLFVDIGAHIGTYSLQYAALGYNVRAFEAKRSTFELLRCGVVINNFQDRVQPIRMALSDGLGFCDLKSLEKHGGGSSICDLPSHATPMAVEEVETCTLDLLAFGNIGFIKLDVEGAEAKVLRGARQTLIESDLPKILFESWSSWRMPEAPVLRSELFSVLDEIGYKVCPIKMYDEMFLAEKK